MYVQQPIYRLFPNRSISSISSHRSVRSWHPWLTETQLRLAGTHSGMAAPDPTEETAAAAVATGAAAAALNGAVALTGAVA